MTVPGYPPRLSPVIPRLSHGPDHPDVAIRAGNMGEILMAKRDVDGALTYTLRALKIYEKVYGADHPKVVCAASSLSVILEAKGDLDGALAYSQRVVDILARQLGQNDPATKAAAANRDRIRQAKAAKQRESRRI